MAATIIVTGRLTKDAESKTIGANNSFMLKFSVAEDVYDREKRTKVPIFYDCSWFGGKQAEAIAQYMLKGSTVQAVGEHSVREYQGKQYQQVDVKFVKLISSKKPGETTQHESAKVNGYQESDGCTAKTDDDFPF